MAGAAYPTCHLSSCIDGCSAQTSLPVDEWTAQLISNFRRRRAEGRQAVPDISESALPFLRSLAGAHSRRGARSRGRFLRADDTSALHPLAHPGRRGSMGRLAHQGADRESSGACRSHRRNVRRRLGRDQRLDDSECMPVPLQESALQERADAKTASRTPSHSTPSSTSRPTPSPLALPTFCPCSSSALVIRIAFSP